MVAAGAYIGSAVIAFLLGFVVQRSRFCMTGAIRDYFLFGITRNLKIVFIILGVLSFVYTLFFTLGYYGGYDVVTISQLSNAGVEFSAGLPDFAPTPVPGDWFSVVGGIIFGVGMALAGGCVTSTFYRIGEGNVNYVIVVLLMLVGIFLGSFLYMGLPELMPGASPTPLLGLSNMGVAYLNEFIPSIAEFPVALGVVQAAIFALGYYVVSRGEA